MCAEYIGVQSETQGTEPSKYLEEEKSKEIPSVAASERGSSPNHAYCAWGCRACNCGVTKLQHSGTALGRPAKEGESPVCEMLESPCRYLSRAGHVKPCLNLGGPPSKAKYETATDSAEVP